MDELAQKMEELTKSKFWRGRCPRLKKNWKRNVENRSEKVTEYEDLKTTVVRLPKSLQEFHERWPTCPTIHGIGKKAQNCSRQIIIHFVKQDCRDVMWQEDRMAWKLFWLWIKAGEQRMRVFFQGPHDLIDNVQILP